MAGSDGLPASNGAVTSESPAVASAVELSPKAPAGSGRVPSPNGSSKEWGMFDDSALSTPTPGVKAPEGSLAFQVPTVNTSDWGKFKNYVEAKKYRWHLFQQLPASIRARKIIGRAIPFANEAHR